MKSTTEARSEKFRARGGMGFISACGLLLAVLSTAAIVMVVPRLAHAMSGMDVSTILIWLAIPVFIVAVVAEIVYLERHGKPYDYRDSATSIAAGLGYQLANVPWALAELAIFAAVSSLVPWRLEGWVAWAVALIGVDLAYYWFHRAHHEIRVFWSVHVVHHSSERFNLTTALRTPWLVVTSLPFLVPLALLGIDGKIIAASYAINLLYQFGIHTEVIDKLWAPVEFVFNTPSHHRVHHGSNTEYLDRNYGGVLIIWDRIFGSFEPEGERVIYGLTKNVDTYNIAKINVREMVAIWQDVKNAAKFSDKLGFLFRGPGWRPQSTLTDTATALE
ncbi:sterol desaturase family protein [Nocardia sp. NPDC004654]|uniref:sterol desaturase family protein n=1 Tax=Nocardia sp. NPDC004654 TaxID=3154776 RepID=UPI0033A0497F